MEVLKMEPKETFMEITEERLKKYLGRAYDYTVATDDCVDVNIEKVVNLSDAFADEMEKFFQKKPEARPIQEKDEIIVSTNDIVEQLHAIGCDRLLYDCKVLNEELNNNVYAPTSDSLYGTPGYISTFEAFEVITSKEKENALAFLNSYNEIHKFDSSVLINSDDDAFLFFHGLLQYLTKIKMEHEEQAGETPKTSPYEKLAHFLVMIKYYKDCMTKDGLDKIRPAFIRMFVDYLRVKRTVSYDKYKKPQETHVHVLPLR